jgi:cytochrome c peroxidase
MKYLPHSSLTHRFVMVAIIALLNLAVGIVVGATETTGASSQAPAEGLTRAEVRRQDQALAELGRAIFFDPSLSASGKMACSSCHDPAQAFGPPNAAAVQLGGGETTQSGTRAVPSLKYLQAVPSFTEHFFDSEDDSDESIDNGPTGGLTWDGRVDRGGDQAKIPLLSPFEMGNKDEAEVVQRLLKAGYGEALTKARQDSSLEPATIFATAVKALEVYEQDFNSFYPYTSKYDAVLAGRATLTAQEARGLKLFNAPEKGNCASCHVSQRGNDGTPPQFTDYGLIALGVPRNPDIPANKNPHYFDLGLCGPLRTDFLDRNDYCGLFRTPTLRNVALRKSFFHNGVFHSLRQAVEFYVERETKPGQWYPRSPDGVVDKYNDLPQTAKANVNMDPPFDRKPGEPPALSPTEIDDMVAFLNTLTDGYRPPN